jgi:hypothetical protein
VISLIISLLILVADVWAIINVIQSDETNGAKALWVVLIVVLPVIGLIVWYFAGPKSAAS